MSSTLASANIANATSVPSAETIIWTSPVMSAGPACVNVNIEAVINMSPGTSTTAVVAKLYRGAAIAAGNLLATSTVTLAAGNNGTVMMAYSDAGSWLNQPAGGQYCLSLTQTGGAGNGSVNIGNVTVTETP